MGPELDITGARSSDVRSVGGIADARPHAARRRVDPDRGRGDAAHIDRFSSGAGTPPLQRRRDFLLQGPERELLVPDAGQRAELWPTRVWPGAVLVDGEIAGTWRRAGAAVKVQAWRRLPSKARDAVELEAQSFPVPELQGRMRVDWEA